MTKIVHLTESLSPQGGGVSVALRGLVDGLKEEDVEQYVVGFTESVDGDHHWDSCETSLIDRSSPLREWLRPSHEELLDGQLYHTHGLWTRLSVVVPRLGKPWVVSPHGMLDPWALEQSAWKKKLARALFENRHLHGAACLHALCQSEADSIRQYGLNNPIAIIPNGVILPEIRRQEAGDRGTEKKTLLFLGRLHPKKGLVNALRAWKEVRGQGAGDRGQDEWQFAVAGWDQGGHEAELKRLCTELDLAYEETPASDFLNLTPGSCPLTPVTFVGPAFGDLKDQLLRRADACILPSFSEGLPMAVLEAWSYQRPVIMTDHCNLPEGFEAGAAIRVMPTVESVSEGMRHLMTLSDEEMKAMGSKGRVLVESRFTWPKVASEMKSVYEWVLGGGEPPGCVQSL